MRELIVTQNITLDGVIDAAEGWFSPSGEGEEVDDQSEIIEAIAEQSARSDALLVGRVTFEHMRGYWPLQTDDPTGIRDHLDRVHKYVVSRTLQEPGWERSTVLRGPLLDDVQRLKAQPGKEIVATGSLTLMPDLIAGAVVDEFRLFVYPRRTWARPAALRRCHHRAAAPPRRGSALSLRNRAPAPPDRLKATMTCTLGRMASR